VDCARVALGFVRCFPGGADLKLTIPLFALRRV
jgi:hypothetical protein